MTEQEMYRFMMGFIIAFPVGMTIGIAIARWLREKVD